MERGESRLADGGREVWWAERRPGTVELRSRIERGAGKGGEAGPARVETVRLVCDEAHRPRALYVAVRDGDGWRTLEALDRNGRWLAVVVAGPDGTRSRTELPLPPGALVDYPSPLFEAVAARRLRLVPGESREVPVLLVEVPSLAARAGVRRYAREAET